MHGSLSEKVPKPLNLVGTHITNFLGSRILLSLKELEPPGTRLESPLIGLLTLRKRQALLTHFALIPVELRLLYLAVSKRGPGGSWLLPFQPLIFNPCIFPQYLSLHPVHGARCTIVCPSHLSSFSRDSLYSKTKGFSVLFSEAGSELAFFQLYPGALAEDVMGSPILSLLQELAYLLALFTRVKVKSLSRV